MTAVVGAIGLLLVVVVLVDTFETVVLPRRVTRRWRITTAVYEATWPPYRAVASKVRSRARREVVLSYYGPASLLLLVACWASLLIFGYGLGIWAFGGRLVGETEHSLGTSLYVAASSFFTLGFGDVVSRTGIGRAILVACGGTGFAFLALVVSYLPTLYQAFSRREVYISQLDARAGSPPSAGELLARNGADEIDQLTTFLADWERWGADLLESVLSFPTLGYYRSHHDNQSWLAGLTVVLDSCSLLLAVHDDRARRQAQLTYAMCRHAAVDLAQVMQAKPDQPADRLSDEQFDRLRTRLGEGGWQVPDSALSKLTKLRAGYEPYVIGLSRQLALPLPDWTARAKAADSWQLTELDERGERPNQPRTRRRLSRPR